MKMLSFLAIGCGLLVVPAAAETVPLSLHRPELPVFPYELVQMGVREGSARVALSVSPAGKLEDVLVVAYTHRPFADATVAAVRRWRFRPAQIDGQPVAATTTVSVDFRLEGTAVISLNSSEHLIALFYRLPTDGNSFRPALPNELDQMPVAIASPSPVWPDEVAATTHGRVAVEFYIDENGQPRMPGVSEDEDPRLAALAVNALSQWRFEPPRAKGQPTVVRAVQIFDFTPSPRRNAPRS